MTTNHRPTLEAKKGRAHTFSDSIKHARNLPQQKELKRRGDIDEDVGRRAVEELKMAPLKRASENELVVSKRQVTSHQKELGTEKEAILQINDTDRNDINSKREDTIKSEDNDDEDANSENDNKVENSDSDSEIERSDNDSEENSDDDSDDQILQELAKIKQEKEAAKAAQPVINKPKPNPLNSNPLLNMENPSRPKKSWRSTTFSNKKDKQDTDDYTTNTVESSTHKKFLSKYVR